MEVPTQGEHSEHDTAPGAEKHDGCKGAVPCCIGMSACGMAIDTNPLKIVRTFAANGVRISIGEVEGPLSRVAAPEPPPPKA
jgi:hypothetical protein